MNLNHGGRQGPLDPWASGRYHVGIVPSARQLEPAPTRHAEVDYRTPANLGILMRVVAAPFGAHRESVDQDTAKSAQFLRVWVVHVEGVVSLVVLTPFSRDHRGSSIFRGPSRKTEDFYSPSATSPVLHRRSHDGDIEEVLRDVVPTRKSFPDDHTRNGK